MKPVPLNNTLLCEKCDELLDAYEQDKSIVALNLVKVPIYKVIDVSKELKDKYAIGDQVVCNSTGTKIKNGDSVKYIFSEANILGKLG